MRKLLLFICLGILWVSQTSYAQVTEPRWEVVSSRNFDLYLPKSSELDYYRLLSDAEKHLEFCEGLLDFHLNESIRLVLSRNENIVKVPVSYNNSHSTEVEFDRHTGYIVSNDDYPSILLQTKNAIVSILFNDLMYGKLFQDRVQNYALLQIQPWIIKGLQAYCNSPWDGRYDGLLRSYFANKESPGFNRLVESDEALAGYSFWKFLIEQYGERNIPNILYISHLSHSFENGLYFVYGKDLPGMMRDWQSYYQGIYSREFPTKPSSASNPTKGTEAMQKISVSPDGKWIAGIRYGAFKTKIYCVNLKSHQSSLVGTLDGHQQVTLRWKSSEQRTELVYNESSPVMESVVFYNPNNRRNTRVVPVRDFDRLLNFDLDHNGNYVFYGVRKSRTFLVRYVGTDKKLETIASNITLLDLYLSDASVWYTLEQDGHQVLLQFRDHADTLLSLPQSQVFKILSVDSEVVRFASNHQGITQIYSFARHGGAIKGLTEFKHESPDLSLATGEGFYFLKGNVNQLRAYYGSFHEMDTVDLPIPFFKLYPHGKNSRPNATCPQDTTVHADTLPVEKARYYFVTGFNEENEKEYRVLLDSMRKAQRENQITVSISKSYELNFATLKVSTLQFDNTPFMNMLEVAPLSPNGIHNYFVQHYLKSEMAIKDILNKYQILGGFRLSANLGGGYDTYLKYEKNYRRYSLSGSVYYYQKRNYLIDYNHLLRNQIQQTSFAYGWKYSNTTRFKIGSSLLWDINSVMSTERVSLSTPSNQHLNWFLQGAYQYNCLLKYTDFLYQGWNIQVQPSAWFNAQSGKVNTLLQAQLKYYKPLYRRIIWSTQLQCFTSQGHDKIVSIMGGAENWIGVKYNEQSQFQETMNFGLRTFGGAVRGFPQNTRNGNNSYCLNSEIRIPVSDFFSKWPSDRFWYQKLMIIPFADMGSAWNGWNLFDQSNNYTSRVFDYSTSARNIARVEVKNFRNPLIGSIGCGVNTKLLGYNLRLDYARGIEDGMFRKAMWLLSYGTNF